MDCHDRGELRVRWQKREDGLEESVQFRPGYNCPVEGGEGHGVHGMEISWVLRGPKGAATFMMFTNWMPGELTPGHGLPRTARMTPGDYERYLKMFPMGADIGRHAAVMQCEWDSEMDCQLLPGGKCFYDGSGLNAHELTALFMVWGEQIIWDELLNVYNNLTEEAWIDPEKEDNPST